MVDRLDSTDEEKDMATTVSEVETQPEKYIIKEQDLTQNTEQDQEPTQVEKTEIIEEQTESEVETEPEKCLVEEPTVSEVETEQKTEIIEEPTVFDVETD